MQSILQSGFLQALTYALLNSIWQMGLLWLAVMLLIRFVKLPSSGKFNIAFIAQLTGFLLFLYSLVYAYTNQKPAASFSELPGSYITNTEDFIKLLTPFISIAYIIVFTWNIIRLIFNYRFTQNLKTKHLVKIPALNRLFVEELTSIFSLHKKVKIYLTDTIKCPLTIGFFKPVILIPLAAINHLTKEQMEAVIVHEVAHIKRADYLLNLLQCIISKIFFFNIFSKMMNDIIERERENACDDWVVRFKYNSFHYAEALLKLGRLQAFYSFAMAASGKKENVLFYRVKRLIHHSEKNNFYQHSSLRFSFLSLLIAIGLMFSVYLKPAVNTTNSYTGVVNKANDNTDFAEHKIAVQPEFFKTNTVKPGVQEEKGFVKNENNKPAKKIIQKGDTRKDEPVIFDKVEPAYFVKVSAPVDSIKQPSYSNALSKKLIATSDAYSKVLSYKNFKQLETMLALTGDSVNITEDPASKDNYKKLITIETTEKDGTKNLYTIIVELYQ